jgi:hypothetical protein
MERTILVTVSDDRSGRKEGKYSETQDKIKSIFQGCPDFGITDFMFMKWDDIKETDFYLENTMILNQFDPAMNGRCYKPFAILEGLKKIAENDFLIYNDTSPEWWVNKDGIDTSTYNLDVIKNLCDVNGGILSADTTWIANGELGDHTHENFTLERCMQKMGMLEYKYSLQHASGMIAMRKNKKSVDFVSEWLKWNLDPECASLGSVHSEPVFPENCICEYWHDEVANHGKIGHRHDQSISGLLINKLGNRLVRNVGNYNFLEYCKNNHNYEFVESNTPPGEFKYRTEFSNNEWRYVKSER